jgi:hypothetical protein
LIEAGQTDVPFFVVLAGEIEVIRPSGLGDLLIAAVRADQFTGDISMILGRQKPRLPYLPLPLHPALSRLVPRLLNLLNLLRLFEGPTIAGALFHFFAQ